MTDTPYWHALRFYSKPWLQRHGADMVTLMHDTADHGEDPLSRAARRSLMLSGLRQRFSTRPYLWMWIAVTLLCTGLYQQASYRGLQIGLYADEHGTSGFDAPTFTATLITGVAFLAALGILTASLLHRPAVGEHPTRTLRAWPGWLLFALGLPTGLGAPLLMASYVLGARRYRLGGGDQFRALAALSAIVLAAQLLIALPVLSVVVLD